MLTTKSSCLWPVALAAGLATSACTYRVIVSQDITEAANSEVPGGSTTGGKVSAERGGLIYSLPMTLVTVTGELDAGKVKYTIAPTIVPDPKARYRLRYAPSHTTDDDLDLHVDRNGLLTSTSKANIIDRTGDIIVALGKTAAAGGNVPFATPAPSPPDRDEGQKYDYPFTAIYDIDQLLAEGGLTLPDKARIRVEKSGVPTDPGAARSCDYSVCFRTVMPIRASLIPPGGVDSAKYQFAFMAVNPHRTEGIDLISASMVTRNNGVTFDNGLLTVVSINQPSTTLALANLPLTVLKAILAVPAELLTLKIKNVQAQSDLVKAQADLVTQTRALLDAQTALQNARNQSGHAGRDTPIVGTGSPP